MLPTQIVSRAKIIRALPTANVFAAISLWSIQHTHIHTPPAHIHMYEITAENDLGNDFFFNFPRCTFQWAAVSIARTTLRTLRISLGIANVVQLMCRSFIYTYVLRGSIAAGPIADLDSDLRSEQKVRECELSHSMPRVFCGYMAQNAKLIVFNWGSHW